MFLQGQLVKLLIRATKSTTIVERTIRRNLARTYRTKYEMEKVYFRNAAKSQELHISFRYTNSTLNLDRDFNFCRRMNEKVSEALTRIRNNIEKECNKKLKKNKLKGKPISVSQTDTVRDEEISVQIVREGSDEVITGITFSELLSDNNHLQNLQLKILDRTFEIALNKPWVTHLVLPSTILSGFKVYPKKLEMQFGERAFSKAQWYRAKRPKSGDWERGATWTKCGDGFFYSTRNEDVGFHLKLVLIPGNSSGDTGPAVETIAKNEIQAGPGLCPFEVRHNFTRERLNGNSFRVVSYNLLADLYADSDYSRTELFPYCPPYALTIDYRKQLFLKELEGYNADVICLQEVDMKIFESDLITVLGSATELNYSGLIEQKGSSGEGIATFYRSNRFSLIKTCGVNIGEQIRNLPEFANVWQKVCANGKLAERVGERGTTLQLSLLKCTEHERYVMVVNTHLYFHPDADHIRLLQIGFAMSYVEHFMRSVKNEFQMLPEEEIALVFCGDFNSVPECGIYKLMTEKFVGIDFVDWHSKEEEAVKDVSLTQPFNMKSACGTPPFTNYTQAFAACLDYIFYDSDNLEVQQVIPLPLEGELKVHTAIPSVVFPSDHLAIVADLRFK